MAPPPSVTFVIPQFGPWPAWTPFFLLSCAANPTVNWLLVGDHAPEDLPPNVTHQFTSLTAYADRIRQALGIQFSPKNAYKLCDVRPAIGLIHAQELNGSNWWGFGDHDVIYGNLRGFLTPDLLETHTLIASHDTQVSGHLTLIRNTACMNNAFRHAKNWRYAFENPEFCGFDEHAFTTATYGHKRLPTWIRRLERAVSPVRRDCLFTERHSTILSQKIWWDGSTSHPTHWRWEKGRLTNTRDGNREFMYLHFMNFKSNRYLPANHGKAAWQDRMDTVRISPEEAARNGFAITPIGFEPITSHP